MKYFLDTEFAESRDSIKLISLAIVAEDGRELYVTSRDFTEADCNEWVRANVLPNLHPPGCPCPGPIERDLIGDCVREFVGKDAEPEFWGYYADYDWVVFCWLFGAMIDLPKGWPMYCRDLKQLADSLGNPRLPKSELHNALEDARCVRDGYALLTAPAPAESERK